ncbi:MAG: response regulator [SAR324 cluster bacterium]|nr:response regulator [SAR324 cluster bacterium]
MQPTKKILVVEDEAIIGMEIASKLKQLGYHIEEIVTSGKKAIEVCAATHPDLVLMDIELKGNIDGIEAAKWVRQYDIPVVFLTSYNDSTTIERAKATLPHGYLLKPFQPKELQTTIEMALYKHQFEKQLKNREFWLNSILKSLWDGIITTDATDNITFINDTAERLTGWTAEEVMGKSYDTILLLQEEKQSLDTLSFIQQIFEEAEDNSLLSHDHLMLINKSEKSIPIEIHATYLKGDQDTIMGKVIVLHDRSERQQLTNKIKEHQQLLIKILTAREKEILNLIVHGQTTKEIASSLFISPRTVEFHRQNVMQKLNVHDLASLIHVALSNKLIPIETE